MPRLEGINKVLIIGSGAIKIGEAGEFDYSGAQAIKAVKEEGVDVVLVNPNVATIQTDPKFVGDKAYFLPITPKFVEGVIEKEKPDGVFLGFGGQTALNCGTDLAESGVFERHGVRVLGTSVEAIERADDRGLFKKTMIEAGIPVPASRTASTVEEAIEGAEELGYPVMVRVAYTLGGQGTGAAYDEEELVRIASIGLAHSRISQVLVEEYVGGWKEIEYEVLRDHEGHCMILCSMENFDPMGIHTGDSIVIAPSQTVTDELYSRLKATSFDVLRALGLVGECNIQFAVHPETGEFRVIEVNSRLSRSSALASKATGYPIAYVTAKISLGYNIQEIVNSSTGEPAASLEPDIDYVVVKMPRWDFHKFRRVNRRLGTQMKSVGEVMAIAKSFEEALQKAVRMLGTDEELMGESCSAATMEEIEEELAHPTDRRLFYIVEAFRRGMSVGEIHELSKITEFFLVKMRRMVDYEGILRRGDLSSAILEEAKRLGFSDKRIGEYAGRSESEVRALREDHGITPYVKQIKTAKRFSDDAYYLYMTYNDSSDDIGFPEREKLVVLGSGCYRIGSSVEFDWCCVNMAWALKDHGVPEVVMVNCNPETVSTDFDVLDKLYFEELTLERVLDIASKERPKGVVTSVGGQIPNRLATRLAASGIEIVGTAAENIDRAEDRSKFSALLDSLGIRQPTWSKLDTTENARAFSNEIGYPVLVRPSYVLSGTAMNVAHDGEELDIYLRQASKVSKEHPVVISKFMTDAKEVEVDGVCDGENVFIGAIIEHVEDAGVHSGDATMAIPVLTISEDVKGEIRRVAREIARSLEIRGPFNIQFLVKDGGIYVIEANLRASRSMPFVSKITGVNLMEMSSSAILGGEIEDGEAPVGRYGVKSPQFSFMRLEGSDPVTGVEMVSTGEVAGFGESFEEALMKALVASGMKIPGKGAPVLLSVGGEKDRAVIIAKKLVAKGYEIYATEHTAEALRENGVDCVKVYKVSEAGVPNIRDLLTGRTLELVINIPSPEKGESEITDGYLIRRRAVEFGVPIVTNIALAERLVSAL